MQTLSWLFKKVKLNSLSLLEGQKQIERNDQRKCNALLKQMSQAWCVCVSVCACVSHINILYKLDYIEAQDFVSGNLESSVCDST